MHMSELIHLLSICLYTPPRQLFKEGSFQIRQRPRINHRARSKAKSHLVFEPILFFPGLCRSQNEPIQPASRPPSSTLPSVVARDCAQATLLVPSTERRLSWWVQLFPPRSKLSLLIERTAGGHKHSITKAAVHVQTLGIRSTEKS